MLECQWQYCTLIGLKQSNDGIYVTLFLKFITKYFVKIKSEIQNLESCDKLNCDEKVGQYQNIETE